MSKEKQDGRDYVNQSVEILNKVSSDLPGLTDKLDTTQIPVWQEQIKTLVDGTPIIMEKLYLKTQGGTRNALKSLEKIKDLEGVVAGVKGNTNDATQAVGNAVAVVDKEFGAFIHKAKTHVIRMT